MLTPHLARQLYLDGSDILKRPRLADHVWMHIWWTVPYLIAPRSVDSFVHAVMVLEKEKIDYRILWAGSNLLIHDGELDFVVVSTKHLSNVHIDGTTLTAEAGVALMRASLLASEHGLSGLEFACGIPGSVGWWVYMNAGAYGGEMTNVITHVTCLDTSSGEVITFTHDEMDFRYRNSRLHDDKHLICLSMQCKLAPSTPAECKATTADFLAKRRDKQPLERPSAGSIFKRPRPDFYVGTAIDELWLKGERRWWVQVSDKHAGFMVNTDNGSFEDLQELISYVKKSVKDEYGEEIVVEPEIW